MKIRQILYVTLSFLATYIGIGSNSVAASTLELTQTSQEIRGIDSDSGVAFQSSLPASNHVVIDAHIGAKRIHADIDYTRHSLIVRSISKANNATVPLSAEDIIAFQKLLVSLPPKVKTETLHGDALTSLINLIASAPAGNAINITSAAPSFTSICPKIGGSGEAIYTLEDGIHRLLVTVGPVCYVPPALGRCGAGAGPDPGIGLVQRFTQQCLNHDQCCVATMQSPPVCGTDCFDEFLAAASGFFFAPDCGTTAGNWTDNYRFSYVLSGGISSGPVIFRKFNGTVNTNVCGTWSVKGTRTDKKIVFTATNPSGASARCAASNTYIGTYNNCNTASGSWVNSSGFRGAWSWSRTNSVNQTVLLSGANAGPGPTDK